MEYKGREKSPLIVLMTDFGSGDAVGVMKGVIAGIAPEARCLDLTHEIEPQQVISGAWVLATSYRYFPEETIFVCVVDPGVGSTREPVALKAGSWYFVGPDNGLFSYILAEQSVDKVVALTRAEYHLGKVSTTFHGRDIFSPVAAHLAEGRELVEVGELRKVEDLQRLPGLVLEREGNKIEGKIIQSDHFGNLITSIPLELIPDFLEVVGVRLTFVGVGGEITERRSFFADTKQEETGGVFLYPDSSEYLGIAVRDGNAAKGLGIGVGEGVRLELFEG